MKDKIFNGGALLRWGVTNKYSLLGCGVIWGMSEIFLFGVGAFFGVRLAIKKYQPEEEPETEYIRCPNCEWETLNKEDIQELIKDEEN